MLQKPKELFIEACELAYYPITQEKVLAEAVSFCKKHNLEWALEDGEDLPYCFWVTSTVSDWSIFMEGDCIEAAVTHAIAAAYSNIHSRRNDRVVNMSDFSKRKKIL